MSLSEEVTIRRATASDLEAVVELCAAHAAFERASFNSAGLQERLFIALFGQTPRALVFLAEFDQKIVGYASCSKEFSTLTGTEFLHMDCLFVAEDFRGQGHGRKFLESIFREAKEQNIDEIQWQTPDWNEHAIHFYRSLGATHSLKARFKQMLF
jgi:ribosomal protein S18 acetylase RimI-like enzyme